MSIDMGDGRSVRMVIRDPVTDLVDRLRAAANNGGEHTELLYEAAEVIRNLEWDVQSALDQADGDNV